jgi:hypothetical protein
MEKIKCHKLLKIIINTNVIMGQIIIWVVIDKLIYCNIK